MSVDSLIIRGLCVSVLLLALAFAQIDLRDMHKPEAKTPTSEVVASQEMDPAKAATP